MKYDFDAFVNRRNTDSLKWDVGDSELPLWVADMDFKTAPKILQKIKERTDNEIFGYSIIPDYWYSAYGDWWERRHNFRLQKDWLMFASGIVPAISSIIRHFTKPDEKILLQTPVYNAFFHICEDNGREIVENPLINDKKGNYFMDFEDLERKLSYPKTTLMILCNPHNPVGRLWESSELKKIGELCAKHKVVVVSDEIHCDLTDPGLSYTPFISVSETCRDNSITCISPTKAFNLAGMKTSALAVPNEAIRRKTQKALSTDCLDEPNSFSCVAADAAFNCGEEWLDELREYLAENKRIVKDYISKELPKITLTPCEATYLMWLDCEKIRGFTSQSPGIIRKKTGLFLSEGKIYGKAGEKCMRMNVACTKAVLSDALDRLKTGISFIEG